LLLLMNDINKFCIYQVYDPLEGFNFRPDTIIGLKYRYFSLSKI